VLTRFAVDREAEPAEYAYVGVNQALDRLPIGGGSNLAAGLAEHLGGRGEDSDQVVKKRLMLLRHGLLLLT
jgi:hypothetical protein